MVHVAKEMERQGFEHSAAHRRRDHQPPAHRGQDRAAVRASRPCTCSTPRARSAVVVSCSTTKQPGDSIARTATSRRSCASCTARKRAKPLLPLRRGRRPIASQIDWRAEDVAVPELHRRARRRRRAARGARRVHRLDVLLHGVGAQGPLSAASSSTRSTARRRAICTRTRSELLARHRRREAADARAPCTASGRRTATATTSCSTPTSRAGASALRFNMLRQQQAEDRRGERRTCRWPTSSRRVGSGVRDYVGAFAVTAGIGADELARELRASSSTTTARSSSRRWPIGWPRRSPRYCTQRARREWGYGASEDAVRRRAHRREVPRHPAGVRLPGLPRPHARRASCSQLLDARVSRHRADRELRDDAGGERERHLLRASGRRATSTSARSAATRSTTTRAASGMTRAEVERWLAPNLGYEPSSSAAGARAGADAA